MKDLLIAFIIFLFLLVLFIELPKTGEFIQSGRDSSRNGTESLVSDSREWRLIGRIYVENGRIVETNFTGIK